ncbi:hypothetical protein [Bacillus infantis]|uniref:hypothetical protein n=1 Tax=Bacillus infantis TaxID=324767 RepID=UPI003CEACB2F
MNRIGRGYEGSDKLEMSVAMQEVLPKVDGMRHYYKFSFLNTDPCSIIINDDGKPKYLREQQGFEISHLDFPIHSFKIVEGGIEFNWMGGYL